MEELCVYQKVILKRIELRAWIGLNYFWSVQWRATVNTTGCFTFLTLIYSVAFFVEYLVPDMSVPH